MQNDQVNELDMRLKKLLIETCNVKNCKPEEIVDDEQLIGGTGKLRLDSLDAVEIIVVLKLQFGINVVDPGEAQKVLRTFATFRDYVVKNRKK